MTTDRPLLVVLRAAALCFLLLAGVPSATAQSDETPITTAEASIASIRNQLQQIQSNVTGGTVNDEGLTQYRQTLAGMRTTLQSSSDALTAPIQQVKEQISKLPPAPASGQTEAPELSAQRKLLGDEQGRLTGAQTQIQVLSVELDQTEAEIMEQQRNRFLRLIFEPRSSILSPSLWSTAIEGLGLIGGRMFANTKFISGMQGLVWPLLSLLVILTGVGLAWWYGVRRLTQRLIDSPAQGAQPTNLARLLRAVWSVAATFIFGQLIALVVLSFLHQTGLLSSKAQAFLSSIATLLVRSATLIVLIERMAAPADTAWRLIPIDDSSARRFAYTSYACAVLAAFSDALGNISDSTYLPISNSIALSAVLSLSMLITMSLANASLRDRSPGKVVAQSKSYFNWAMKFRGPVWGVLVIVAGALLLGYIALADYLLFRVFATLALASFLFLIEYTADAASSAAIDAHAPLGAMVRRITGWSAPNIERVTLLVRGAVDILLVVIGVPALIALWAVNWINFRGLTNRIFFSVAVGDVTISPWTVLMIILLIVAGITVTKLLVRWLDKRLLTPAHLDRGLQDSISTGVKYMGYVVAIAFALSAAGINLSSLAIIAGALGVGIGFGLQSIVNNFVSGIILLAERPVRVGDWLDTPQGQGVVKRINVRSTLMETFDGCSVIIPNSSFITNTLKNWTFNHSRGVITVSIAVPHDADPDKISALLLAVLKDNAKVLHFPEPSVILADITAYALNFDMKGTVGDIFEGATISGDLRCEVVKRFHAEGISFAQPPILVNKE